MECDVFLYNDYAGFYDWIYEERHEDIEFYSRFVSKGYTHLLELACGTGRITIPLAEKGAFITGLDFSQEMLNIAKKKLESKPDAVRDRVDFIQGNAIDFSIDKVYDMIFIPQASMFHIHENSQRRNCVSCMKSHLRPSGIAVFDFVNSSFMENQETCKSYIVNEGINSDTGKLTKELNEKLIIDKDNHFIVVKHTYVETDDSGEKRYEFIQRYTWVTLDEISSMLTEFGFSEIEVVGGYRNEPFNIDSYRMIVTACLH